MQKGDLQSFVGFLKSVGILSCLPFLQARTMGKGNCADKGKLKVKKKNSAGGWNRKRKRS